MMFENYIFSHNQLKVLLLGCGYSHITGLWLNDLVLDNETVLMSLNRLSNDGMIISDGKKFFGSKMAKKIAERLGTSEFYIAVHTSNGSLPDLCCYPGEKILICSNQSRDENHISIRFSAFEDFFCDLCDEGYLPENDEKFKLDEEELENYEAKIFDHYESNSPINYGSPLLFTTELLDSYGTNHGYLRIIEYYFYNYILFCYDGKIKRQLCNRERIKAYLKRLMS